MLCDGKLRDVKPNESFQKGTKTSTLIELSQDEWKFVWGIIKYAGKMN